MHGKSMAEWTDAVPSLGDRVATMTEHLRPHAGNLKALWDAMPGAFLAAHGREVDKTNDHDLMLCHAALAPFNLEAD
jgi:hypothetical protein